MKTPIISLLFCFLAQLSFAQNQDCVTAIELLTKDSIVVNDINGSGDFDENYVNDCLSVGDLESQSSWYTFSAVEAGNFYFTIKPMNPMDDLDFYLFKTPSGTCAGLESVRCNASSCVGTTGYTGMAPNDSDIFENLNCDEGENAYTQDIELEVGDKYYLLVNNFTINEGFTLVFCGRAKLGPDDMVCNNGILHNEEFSNKTYTISPNPSNGFIEISDYQEIESIDLMSIQGVKVEQINSIDSRILLNHPAGMYYLKLNLFNGKKAISSVVLFN